MARSQVRKNAITLPELSAITVGELQTITLPELSAITLPIRTNLKVLTISRGIEDLVRVSGNAERSVKSYEEQAMRYSFSLSWSDEDEVYLARVAEWPSLGAHGNTLESALSEIVKVVALSIEDCVEAGHAFPPPDLV